MTWNWALGLGGLLLLPALPLRADSLGDAYRAYEKGQFEEAAKGFQSHAQKQPEDYDQLYNTGVALFQKGAHDEAMTYFDRAMQSPDPGLKSRSAYNKGVALAQKQKWEEAEAAFQNALSYDNENTMIQDNLQFVREQKNRQKQENPQENQAQNDQQQKKDGKSEDKQAENQPGQPQGGKPEDQQAQNQTGQGQSLEQKKAEQAKEAQKQAGQEKSGQSEAEKKAAEAGQEKPGQTEAQKQAAQEKAGQAGDKGTQVGGQPGAQPQEGQRVLTVKDLKKQEAEKILRSVDDRIGTYILTPEQANTEGKSRNGKDW